MRTRLALIVAILLAGCTTTPRPTSAPPPAAALRSGDEGMWTLDNLPLAELKKRFGFEPTPAWVEHLRLSAVRFGGGSGALVSANGLVVTNHHVALGQLQKLSTPEHDYVRNGFFAHMRDQELKCPDLELGVLVSMENVTGGIVAAVDPSASIDEQNKQRKAEMSRIEKEATDRTHLRCEVVTLYGGGEYWLYSYKRYTDVRLVMAPQMQAAFYGGDSDNFTYPRYCLDFSFMRVYEDGHPAQTPNYLRWSSNGPSEGDLVFVVGHPGRTHRLSTVAQLKFFRDVRLPTALAMMKSRRQALLDYAARGAEEARQAKGSIFGVENGIKAYTGRLEGLEDAKVMERLEQAEASLREAVRQRPELQKRCGDAWDRLASVVSLERQRYPQMTHYGLWGSRLEDIASTIQSYVVEVAKPNASRYREYRDSNLPSLNLWLFSPAPVYKEMEQAMLAWSLTQAKAALGPDDPLVQAALQGREPAEVARELITGTRLDDPAFRRQLVEGGQAAVDASTDPLIRFARRLDPIRRQLREWEENNLQGVDAIEGRRIAQARFAIYGHSTYPDATGTLRLSFGRVMGYELGTTQVPWKTTFYGLYGRAASFDGKLPFNLASAVDQARSSVELPGPVDFVSTNDIIGGNSGSPVINRNGEYVGAIFDGNIQSLVWDYVYSDRTGRAVAVHSSAILQALRTIYPMPELVKELTGG